MDWKEYRETPDDGMFEAIQKRLRVRRAWRIGGGVAVLAVAAAVVTLAVSAPKDETVAEEPLVVAAVQAEPEAVAATVQADAVAPVATAVKADEQGREGQTVSILPEPQMQVVAVAEPVDVNVAQTMTFAVPAVSPRQARNVASEKEENLVQAEPKTDANAETVAKLDTKFGGMEPEPYHEDNLIWAPNVIAPASEKDENRVFKVIATSELKEFHMYIYNRGGRRVFSTSDINAAWDATIGGTMVPQGAYVWVATFRDSDGVSRRETGTVTVIR